LTAVDLFDHQYGKFWINPPLYSILAKLHKGLCCGDYKNNISKPDVNECLKAVINFMDI